MKIALGVLDLQDPPTPFPILNVYRPYNSVSTTVLHCDSVRVTVSTMTNRFLFVTGSRTLGFGLRRYGRLFLAIAGLLVHNVVASLV